MRPTVAAMSNLLGSTATGPSQRFWRSWSDHPIRRGSRRPARGGHRTGPGDRVWRKSDRPPAGNPRRLRTFYVFAPSGRSARRANATAWEASAPLRRCRRAWLRDPRGSWRSPAASRCCPRDPLRCRRPATPTRRTRRPGWPTRRISAATWRPADAPERCQPADRPPGPADHPA